MAQCRIFLSVIGGAIEMGDKNLEDFSGLLQINLNFTPTTADTAVLLNPGPLTQVSWEFKKYLISGSYSEGPPGVDGDAVIDCGAYGSSIFLLFYSITRNNLYQISKTTEGWGVWQPTAFASAPVGQIYSPYPGAGIEIPNPGAGWIRLKSGLVGPGAYNEGKLASESVTGSFPEIFSTAVIIDSLSPMNGQTVRLVEDEQRYFKPGSPGTIRESAIRDHEHSATSPQGDLGDAMQLVNDGSGGTYGLVMGLHLDIGQMRGGMVQPVYNPSSGTWPRDIGTEVYLKIR